MLTVISPAKTLDFETPPLTEEFTQPAHLRESRKLVKELKDYSAKDLSSLMGVSDKIAAINEQRFKKWKTPFKPVNARQALFAFKGDVYAGLDAYSMTRKNIDFAQAHLRILSGLYGVLRPLDLMQPYRLEMGTRLQVGDNSNLYQFWDGRITDAINEDLKTMDNPVLINLASNEYFKSVQTKKLKGDIITPEFKEFRNNKYSIISFFAKKARGQMSRFIIDNEITEPEAIKDFDIDGYRFNDSLSTGNKWVFSRRQ